MSFRKIHFQSLKLTPVTHKHAWFMRSLRNDNRQFFGDQSEVTREGHDKWLARYTASKNETMFVVEVTGADNITQLAGVLGLYDIDETTGRATFGRLIIDERHRGRGIAMAAMSILIGMGFGEWGLKQIDLEVREENQTARRLYRRLGFTDTAVANGMVAMSLKRGPAREAVAA